MCGLLGRPPQPTLQDVGNDAGNVDAPAVQAKLPEVAAAAKRAMPAELLKELASATRRLLAGSTEGSVPAEVNPPDTSKSSPTPADQLHYHGDVHSSEAKLASPAEHAAFVCMPDLAASADKISQPPADAPAAGDDAEEEEQVCVQRGLAKPDHSPSVILAAEEAVEHCQAADKQPNQASGRDISNESADQASSRRWVRLRQKSAKGQLSTRRSRAGSYEPDHCHESDYLSHGHDSSGHPAPFSANSALPQGETFEHHDRGQLGIRDGDPRSWCTWEEEDSSPPEHESPGDSSWRDTIRVADSAPPVTPDSPTRSAMLRKLPSWCSSREATPNGPRHRPPVFGSPAPWESPPRAAPDSPRQSAWDSPSRSCSHSPALHNATISGRFQWRSGFNAGSSSPQPCSNYGRYTRPANDSSPYPALPDQDPYGGGVAGGLDGDYAYGSYQYSPPPETPHSPNHPPNSPPCGPYGIALHQMAVQDEAANLVHVASYPAGSGYPCSASVAGGEDGSYAHGRCGFSPAASTPKSPSQPPHSPSRSPPRRHAYPVYPGRRDLACSIPAMDRHGSPDFDASPNPFELPAKAACSLSSDGVQAEEVKDAQKRPPVLEALPSCVEGLARWREASATAAAAKPGQGDSPLQAEEEGARGTVNATLRVQLNDIVVWRLNCLLLAVQKQACRAVHAASCMPAQSQL